MEINDHCTNTDHSRGNNSNAISQVNHANMTTTEIIFISTNNVSHKSIKVYDMVSMIAITPKPTKQQ